MKKKQIYIIISIVVVLLIAGLSGWGYFIIKKQKQLQETTLDIGYINSPGAGSFSGDNFFKKVVDSIRKDVNKETNLNTSTLPVLRQIYTLPTSGYYASSIGTTTIRFVESTTGHVFEKNLQSGKTVRIFQDTLKGILNAIFIKDGSAIIRQYINDKESISSIYNTISEENPQTLQFSDDILNIITSPDGQNIAYIQKTDDGSVMIVANQDNSSQRILFSSPIRGWNIEWEQNIILLTQKPSGNLPSSAYLVNQKTGERKLLLQQVAGLSTLLSNDGTKILYNEMKDTPIPILKLYDLKTGKTTSLDIYGLVDKCTWSKSGSKTVICAIPNNFPDGLYPDDWYQGVIHFKDSLWSIDTNTLLMKKIISLDGSGGLSIDAYKLNTTVDGSIFFLNYYDQTLWSIIFPKQEQQTNSASNTPPKNI